jgi:hypothetical protein
MTPSDSEDDGRQPEKSERPEDVTDNEARGPPQDR